MERETLKSRLGFILLSAGCAIGIGNVWKFPYIAGQGGGGAFVLFYLIFLVILGLPIMTMEFAVGRASRKSPVRAYQALEKPGQKWHIHGYFTLIGCYLLMMFYTTVAGWMLHYFYMTAAGKLAGLNAEQVAGKFTEMLASPATMTFWMVFVVVVSILVCAKGLQSGLERVTKGMMIALLLIMVVLAVNSLFMPGAKEGLCLLPCAGLYPDAGGGRGQHTGLRHESGLLHPEPWHRSHVHFWQLYRQGTLSAGRVCPYRGSGYLRSHHRRIDHLPGLFYLPCRPDQRPQPDLYHPAQHLCQYVHGAAVGQPVLFVHGLCSHVHRAGSIREHHLLRHGTDRLQPQKCPVW